MIVTYFYSLVYKKGVGGCFITSCAMVVLVQFLPFIMPGIERKETNARFVRKDTQHLCMVKKQRKVRLSNQTVTPQKNQK